MKKTLIILLILSFVPALLTAQPREEVKKDTPAKTGPGLKQWEQGVINILWENTDVSSEPTYRCIVIGDANLDGIDDTIVVGDYDSPTAYIINFDGSTRAILNYDGSSVRAVAIGEIDGDGAAEVVIAGYGSNYVRIYDANTGSEEAYSPWEILVGHVISHYGSLKVGDVDNDGLDEIALGTAGYPYDENYVEVVEYSGGTLVSKWNSGPLDLDEIVCLTLGEFDGTTGLDIVCKIWGSSNPLLGFRGSDGTQLFSTVLSPSTTYVYDFAVVDIDGDSLDEIAAAGYGGLYIIDDDGTQLTCYETSDTACSVYAGDIDGDANVDFAVGDYDDYIYALEWDGTQLVELWNYFDGDTGDWMLDVAIGDLNADGVNEVVGVDDSSADTGEYQLIVLNNDGSVLDRYADTDDLELVELADLDGDGALEIVFGGGSLKAADIPLPSEPAIAIILILAAILILSKRL